MPRPGQIAFEVCWTPDWNSDAGEEPEERIIRVKTMEAAIGRATEAAKQDAWKHATIQEVRWEPHEDPIPGHMGDWVPVGQESEIFAEAAQNVGQTNIHRRILEGTVIAVHFFYRGNEPPRITRWTLDEVPRPMSGCTRTRLRALWLGLTGTLLETGTVPEPEGQETAFLRAIADDPLDPMRQLVYADWLEDRGDAGAAGVRERAERVKGLVVAETLAKDQHVAGLMRGFGVPAELLVNDDSDYVGADLDRLFAPSVS